jgi:hypothetical protein
MRSFFEDERGRIVVWQFPNLPLWVWAASTIASRFWSGRPGAAASLVAFGALFTWAWLELFDGASRFRRLLGAVVLIAAVASRISP